VLDNHFSSEIFPNIQSKPPLTQLETLSSRGITCYVGKETNPHLTTPSFQAVLESNKVPPQPPLLQAEQPQLPQPLLTGLVLQTLPWLCCPSLDTLQHLDVLLVARGQRLRGAVLLSSTALPGETRVHEGSCLLRGVGGKGAVFQPALQGNSPCMSLLWAGQRSCDGGRKLSQGMDDILLLPADDIPACPYEEGGRV